MTDQPMQAHDAELHLLGAAMSGAPDLDDLLELVRPEDFYAPLHEQVWAAVGRVHRAGNKPDPVSVRLALAAAEVRHDPLLLVHMAEGVPFVGQAGYYAERVVEAAGLRALQTAGIAVQQLGSKPGDVEDRRERARQVIDEACNGRAISRARTLAAILPSVIDTAQHGQTAVLDTPWPDLDRLIGGLAPGRLVVFGARPGTGKSLCGTNLALHFAHRHAHAVLVASLEMPEQEVGQRMLAAFASANLTGLAMGRTDEAAWNRIAAKTSDLDALPITIDDTPAQTVTGIRRAARNVQRMRDDLALIVVDYLQLMRGESRGSNTSRAEQVGEFSRGLKLIARETGACVVAMAQVNRESTRRTDGRPTMADLRESGAIEADADQVVLMHQPDDEVPELELIVDKNRHGPKGVARLQVQGHYARLVSIERAPWSPTRAIES